MKGAGQPPERLRLGVRAGRAIDIVTDVWPQPMVVRGAPTPEQLAALLAVVSGAARSTPVSIQGDRPGAASLWAVLALRPHLASGPGGWRASALLGGR